jgi:hypothetical protein
MVSRYLQANTQLHLVNAVAGALSEKPSLPPRSENVLENANFTVRAQYFGLNQREISALYREARASGYASPDSARRVQDWRQDNRFANGGDILATIVGNVERVGGRNAVFTLREGLARELANARSGMTLGPGVPEKRDYYEAHTPFNAEDADARAAKREAGIEFVMRLRARAPADSTLQSALRKIHARQAGFLLEKRTQGIPEMIDVRGMQEYLRTITGREHSELLPSPYVQSSPLAMTARERFGRVAGMAFRETRRMDRERERRG